MLDFALMEMAGSRVVVARHAMLATRAKPSPRAPRSPRQLAIVV